MREKKGQPAISNSAEETMEMGRRLSQTLKAGDVLAFCGDLGSGKTTFIKGVCKGLEVEREITSPTFTLIHEYSGRLPIYHFDFYRIADADEAWELGCEDYFYGQGVCLIEWADRIPSLLPEKRIEIHLKNPFQKGFPDRREIRIKTHEVAYN